MKFLNDMEPPQIKSRDAILNEAMLAPDFWTVNGKKVRRISLADAVILNELGIDIFNFEATKASMKSLCILVFVCCAPVDDVETVFFNDRKNFDREALRFFRTIPDAELPAIVAAITRDKDAFEQAQIDIENSSSAGGTKNAQAQARAQTSLG